MKANEANTSKEGFPAALRGREVSGAEWQAGFNARVKAIAAAACGEGA
jgi:hypothetical protein